MSIKQWFCSHDESLVSEKVLEYDGGPVELRGGFSIHKHLIAMHAKTLVQTFKCCKCKRARTKVVRHSPIG